ncbi:MAG: acyl-CoA dehydrogenase family protein [Mycobacteriales bacterium]
MDTRLSPEQRALRDAAAQLVDRLAPKSVADLDDEERKAKLDAAVAAAGWREVRTADEDGGPCASAVEAALVAEELARGLADVAYLGPSLAAEPRRLAGAAAALASETVLLTSDHSALLRTTGMTKGAVAVDAAGANSALLLVESERGPAVAQVGLTDPLARVDLTRKELVLEAGVDVQPVGAPLGEQDLRRWTAFGLALSCADLVGTMRGAVALATDYAATRRQYGAPIGSFQAVQHLLADAYVAMEGSRSIALHAAWAVDALPPAEALTAASVAKAYCARAARNVCETAIQVHGGIGNTWECLAHVYLRRALLSSDVLGGAAHSLARVLDAYEIGTDRGLR